MEEYCIVRHTEPTVPIDDTRFISADAAYQAIRARPDTSPSTHGILLRRQPGPDRAADYVQEMAAPSDSLFGGCLAWTMVIVFLSLFVIALGTQKHGHRMSTTEYVRTYGLPPAPR